MTKRDPRDARHFNDQQRAAIAAANAKAQGDDTTEGLLAAEEVRAILLALPERALKIALGHIELCRDCGGDTRGRGPCQCENDE